MGVEVKDVFSVVAVVAITADEYNAGVREAKWVVGRERESVWAAWLSGCGMGSSPPTHPIHPSTSHHTHLSFVSLCRALSLSVCVSLFHPLVSSSLLDWLAGWLACQCQCQPGYCPLSIIHSSTHPSIYPFIPSNLPKGSWSDSPGQHPLARSPGGERCTTRLGTIRRYIRRGPDRLYP